MTDPAVWSPGLALMGHHRRVVSQILECIEEGVYCTLLGPHFSGKTLLVHAVEEMAHARQWPCVYIDLSKMEATTQRGFFGRLAQVTAERLRELTGLALTTPVVAAASSADFRGFLTDAIARMQRDLVLLIDQLEAVPTDLVQALLTSLRVAFMEQQLLEYRLLVVTSGALSLATLAVGESSPFRGIARRIFVEDLSEEESHEQVAEQLAGVSVQASKRAQDRLVTVARGDPYLMRRLCQGAVRKALATRSGHLTVRTVDHVVNEFLEDEVHYYAPLQEAVRAIEDDPDLLRAVLLLLAQEDVARGALPLPLSPDVDPLYLTGVVAREGDRYRVRNEIYRKYLTERLDPARVGHLLTMAGQWDSAIDYLEDSIQPGSDPYRSDLLLATIHSMYASEDLSRASHFLLRGLSAAFNVEEAQVWLASPDENALRLIGLSDGAHPSPLRRASVSEGSKIALQEDCLEARAFREASPLRGQEGSQGVMRAIPLITEGRRPIGVVCVAEWLQDRIVEQRDREQQMMGYLNQASRAFEQVTRRTQELALAGRVQAGLLPPVPQVADWQIVAMFQPARVVAGDFYDFIKLPGGRLGILIADVADKGLGAALYMALCRTLIRTFALQYPAEPARVLEMTSRRMLEDARAGLFVTAFYGVLDLATGSLTYCNAGHHPPLLLNGNATPSHPTADRGSAHSDSPASLRSALADSQAGGRGEIEELGRTGMALGASEEAAWKQAMVVVEPEGLLVLYTDGVVDAQNRERELFGKERLLAAVQGSRGLSAGEVQAAVLGAVREFARDEPPYDDIALVVTRRLEAAKAPAEREPGAWGRRAAA